METQNWISSLMCSRGLKKRRAVHTHTHTHSADMLPVPQIWTFIFSRDRARLLALPYIHSIKFQMSKVHESLTAQWLSPAPGGCEQGELHWHRVRIGLTVISLSRRIMSQVWIATSPYLRAHTHTHRTAECRAGGGARVVSSPAYFVIAPSASLLGWRRRKTRRRRRRREEGVTCFKPCAVTRVASLALNFKQNMQGGGRGLQGRGGGGGGGGGGERGVWGCLGFSSRHGV